MVGPFRSTRAGWVDVVGLGDLEDEAARDAGDELHGADVPGLWCPLVAAVVVRLRGDPGAGLGAGDVVGAGASRSRRWMAGCANISFTLLT